MQNTVPEYQYLQLDHGKPQTESFIDWVDDMSDFKNRSL